jgi:hypothetical protein
LYFNSVVCIYLLILVCSFQNIRFFTPNLCCLFFIVHTPRENTRSEIHTRVFLPAGFFTSRHVCYKLDETRLLRIEFDKLATALFQQTCSKSVDKLATNLMPTSLLQHRHDRIATSPSTSCYKSVTTSLGQPVRAHLVNKLLVQTYYKSAAGL